MKRNDNIIRIINVIWSNINQDLTLNEIILSLCSVFSHYVRLSKLVCSLLAKLGPDWRSCVCNQATNQPINNYFLKIQLSDLGSLRGPWQYVVYHFCLWAHSGGVCGGEEILYQFPLLPRLNESLQKLQDVYLKINDCFQNI